MSGRRKDPLARICPVVDPALCPPQDIEAGDMSKKSLWEQKGGSKTSSTIKVSKPIWRRLHPILKDFLETAAYPCYSYLLDA